jgi:hypothetical protein
MANLEREVQAEMDRRINKRDGSAAELLTRFVARAYRALGDRGPAVLGIQTHGEADHQALLRRAAKQGRMNRLARFMLLLGSLAPVAAQPPLLRRATTYTRRTAHLPDEGG